ncbi:MAG: phosphodiesterase [Clostridia bacterium]|jgi:glycerophosphoryl diester phosphodiesterase|nr:phosphodiesterase [Clostridia bacterium]
METFLKTLPVAHRGLHDGTAPENSLSAFRAAIQLGYAVETDVRLSKDGELIIYHDDVLSRLTQSSRKVVDCTKDELKKLLLEGKEPIPTLQEFLECIGGAVPILLEIKNVPEWNTRDFIAKVAAAFDGYEGEYAVQSFVPAYVKEYKKLRPAVPCGILATAGSSKADYGNSLFWRIKAYAVKHMSFNRSIKPDFISYSFMHYPNPATEKFKGIKLGWTVRSPEEEEYTRKYADNIIFEGYLAEKR